MATEMKTLMHRLEELKAAVNPSPLHYFDQERVVEFVWQLARDGDLKEHDIKAIVRDELRWRENHLTLYLLKAVDVLEVMYPMVVRGEIKLV